MTGYRTIDATGNGAADGAPGGGVWAEGSPGLARWFRTPGGPLGTLLFTAEEVGTTIMVGIGEAMTLDRIGVNVTTAGEAGSLIRLGIYGPTPPSRDLVAGATPLLLDAGTVAADTTGFKEITISQAVEAGWYALVAVAQACPTTRPTVSSHNASTHGNPAISIVTAAATVAYNGYQQTSYASGALPSQPARNGGQANNVATVFLRQSA